MASPILAILYAFITLTYLMGVKGPDGIIHPLWMAIPVGITTLYFGGLAFSVRRFRYSQKKEDLWIGVSVLVMIANVTGPYSVNATNWNNYHFLFIILGMGAVVSHLNWYLFLMGANIVAVLVTTYVGQGNDTDWALLLSTCTIASIVSGLMVVMRRAAVERVHALTLDSDRKRQVAEEALAVAERAQADLQQLVAKAPDAVLIIIDDTIHYANETFLNCVRRKQEDVLQRSLSELTRAGRLETNRSSRLSFARADGETVILEFSEATNIQQEGKEAQLFIGRDVSAADSDLQAKLQLSDRMAAIGVLAAGVAHEINNPLAYVLGNLSALQDDSDKFVQGMTAEAKGEFVELVADSLHGAHRVAAIVKDLNSIARTETEESKANVEQALQSSIRIAQPHLTRNSRLLIEIQDVPDVACNQARLSQICLNLIINAAHSLPDSRDNKITIRCNLAPRGEGVLIEIEDTGCGMSAETQRRLFEPFFTTKAVGEGTGLGLYYCMNEVEKCGGELNFTSEVGKGTCFRIVLPFFQASQIEKIRRPIVKMTKGMRILIIDDDVLVCRALQRLLRGNDTIVLNSATEAMQRIQTDIFDVIFCDLMMPGMTGDKLYWKSEELLPGIGKKFIFITGGAFTPGTEQFLGSVPALVVMKPFGKNSLQQALLAVTQAA
ncbi:MAG: response regulator [Kofleriaceae bacterium]|nr:response regulator [Kofleriaceae bacterium]